MELAHHKSYVANHTRTGFVKSYTFVLFRFLNILGHCIFKVETYSDVGSNRPYTH